MICTRVEHKENVVNKNQFQRSKKHHTFAQICQKSLDFFYFLSIRWKNWYETVFFTNKKLFQVLVINLISAELNASKKSSTLSCVQIIIAKSQELHLIKSLRAIFLIE